MPVLSVCRSPRAWSALPLLLLLPAFASAGGGEGGSSAAGFSLWHLLGRFHVLIVHFPIALLAVVAFIESLRLWRRARAPDATVTMLAVLGAASAVGAAVLGWAQADAMSFSGREAELVKVHRWLGIATAVLAVVVALLALRLQLHVDPVLRRIYLAVLLVTVVVVSIAGHYGGLLVHGEDYFTSALPAWARPQAALVTDAGHGSNATAGGSGERVDFSRDVEPIFKSVCYECHNAEKQKGDLRMDSREALLKGGATGPALVPGDSHKSLLIDRVLGLGDDPRMPKKKDPLTTPQIDLLKRWIDQGAPWAQGLAAKPAN